MVAADCRSLEHPAERHCLEHAEQVVLPADSLLAVVGREQRLLVPAIDAFVVLHRSSCLAFQVVRQRCLRYQSYQSCPTQKMFQQSYQQVRVPLRTRIQ